MSFVPIIVTPPPQPPSPQARELGRRLSEAIESFRHEHPTMSRTEICQALRLAAPPGGSARGLWIALLLTAALVGLVALIALI